MSGFPVTLDLAGARVLVVGSDIARCRQMIAQGAAVILVDLLPSAEAIRLAAEGSVELRRRAFAATDLDGVRLCFVSGPDTQPAVAAARARGVFVNVVDGGGSDFAAPPAKARVAGGHAALVGAGPGDPSLLTLKARDAIASADVVLFDKLVNPAVLDLAPPQARRIDVGKRCGRHAMQQDAINALIVRHVRLGQRVVRLKGGDPFVFGRGGEELDALRAAGATAEVIPGVTAALAAAADLGLPLTHRGVARSLHLLTAHGTQGLAEHDWDALVRTKGTLAIYMGMRALPELAARLRAVGMAADTPALAVENASLAIRRHVKGTLADLPDRVAAWAPDGPTLVLIGQVVGLMQEATHDAADHDAGGARCAA